ncbi:MAG: DNA/RNA non-specific endonuclease [Gemmatimonas sp.]
MRTRPRSAALVLFATLLASCTERTPLTPVPPEAAARLDVGTTALPPVRISEIHYDNAGTDAGEAIEISGPAGTNLTGYSIVLYNGNNANAAVTYTPLVNLTATIPANCTLDNTRGVVVQNYAVNGIQNGDPDGIALVNGGVVVEFISYGGTMTASNGPAAGLTSVDIGVKESSTTPVGHSLKRNGAGVWSAPSANSFGTCNDDGGTPPPAAVVASVVVTPASASVEIGATQQFTAVARDSSNNTINGVTFTWASTNTSAASVSTSGLATGVALGASNITATAPNGVVGTASMTVVEGPPPPTLPETRFSEIHYDNLSVDVNERIEIEGPAGTDLTGWSVVLYNGNGGAPYNTFSLSGTIPTTCTGGTRGVVVVSYPQDAVQNGAPDGFALVNAASQVVEFLSYEGVFVASGGAASGMQSTDIGVNETSAPYGQSLKRNAQGVWSAPSTANFGACNSGGGTPLSNSSIEFSGRVASDPALPVGYQDQLFTTVRDGAGNAVSTTVTWMSDTPAIASIDNRGVMTAQSVGNAVLRATTAEGFTATYVLATRIAVAGAANYANNAEFGEPTDGMPADDFILRHPQFTSSFSNVRNTPNWVAYEIDATHFGTEDRCDCFTYDPDLPASYTRYTTADYTGAGAIAGYGIDRGHLARSFDRTAGSLDNARSFLFSNIIPQAADVNQGPWAIMENALGDYARLQNKEVYVIAGVAGNKGTVKNEGLIVIPTYVWKVAVIMPRDQGLANVVTGREPEVIAVVMPNGPGVNGDWNTYRVTVDSVEALSGYDLLALLPDAIESQLESGNRFPTANINGPYSGNEGAAIAFSAAGSSDPDAGDVLSYSWSFGDGTTATGVSPSKTYANNGTYTVTLTVTDQKGAKSVATTSATVANVPPVVTVTPPASWTAGVSANLAVSFTDVSTKEAPFAVRISWGDNTPDAQFVSTTLPKTPFQRPHVYAAPGTYTIVVTVSDRDGGISSKTFLVTVQ